MKIIEPRVCPCQACKGDSRNFGLCYGCGGWALIFKDERENLYALPFDREPTLSEVIATLAEWHAGVRAEEARGAVLN